MDGDIAIVVPMKVWTPGLHGFRAKYLQSSRVMIPPHISILELSETHRARNEETERLANLLQGFSHRLLAFAYTLSRLVWDEESQTLSLQPNAVDGFSTLRRCIQEELKIAVDYREKYEGKLMLAENCDRSQYELEEAFQLMNGNAFSISCRATEMEIYRKRSGDWLLREVIPMPESEEN